MDTLSRLNAKNDIPIYNVNGEEFRTFGRVLHDLDVTDILKAGEQIANPADGSAYVPSEPSFETLPIAKEIAERYFGTMPTQIGYCWGHSNFLNATEWHTSSEVNIAVTDLVLLLGHVWDIRDNRIDASQFTAFYLPKGTAVEVYATSLHFCPCEVSENGFGAVVALPSGTNVPLSEPVDDPLLFRQNKWIIAHDDNASLIQRGVVAGIGGPNYKIAY
jgi:hypothetical protein